jgi:hydrogenase maturation factor
MFMEKPETAEFLPVCCGRSSTIPRTGLHYIAKFIVRIVRTVRIPGCPIICADGADAADGHLQTVMVA